MAKCRSRRVLPGFVNLTSAVVTDDLYQILLDQGLSGQTPVYLGTTESQLFYSPSIGRDNLATYFRVTPVTENGMQLFSIRSPIVPTASAHVQPRSDGSFQISFVNQPDAQAQLFYFREVEDEPEGTQYFNIFFDYPRDPGEPPQVVHWAPRLPSNQQRPPARRIVGQTGCSDLAKFRLVRKPTEEAQVGLQSLTLDCKVAVKAKM